MGDPSRVGEARRLAAEMSGALGFDDVQAGRLALAVNELGNNLLRHAVGGRLLLGAHELDGIAAIDLLSIDDGPGMADLGTCLRDGFSSAGTAGQGLGAVSRAADDFDIHSRAGEGSVILARFYRDREPGGGPRRPASGFSLGAVSLPAPGETACGDGWDACFHDGCADVVVIDGLGHGAGAAEVADAALEVFGQHCGSLPARLIELSHPALRGTRGAAVGAARVDTRSGRVQFAGAGNIMGRVMTGLGDRTLISQSGTVGLQIRTVTDHAVAFPAHALVILHSDGIRSRWQLDAALFQRDPAIVAAYILSKFCRGKDDATVVVLRRAKD